jgi:acetylglutamate kinase
MKENMFYGAGPLIFKRAEDLRKNMTSAEKIIWQHIHINEWKLKFRRQHPISNFVVDFYCHPIKLVIEIDGDIHENEDEKKKDISREKTLISFGLKILRFNNEDVYKNSKDVLKKIDATIRTLQSPPLGDGGRETLYVIKIGGNIIDDETKLREFLKNFAGIQTPRQPAGMGVARKILVHGGGKLATQLAEKLGIEQKLVDGRRITDAETLKVVTMVYAGYINKNIVAQLQSHDCNAIGLCGADGNAILAHKRNSNPHSLKVSKEVSNYGFVGDIDKVSVSLFNNLLQQNFALVIAPVTHDKEGQLLNTNADTIAQEIAKAMSKDYDVTLIYSFEKAGVLKNVNDENSVIRKLSWNYYQELKSPLQGMEASKIFAGMIPKLDNAFAALNSGVKTITIGKAEQLKELINGQSGTTIVNE